MIQWKVSVISFAVGALASVGFVWLRRARERTSTVRVNELPLDADAAARADALRDVGDAALEIELTEPLELEPLDVKSLDGELSDRAIGGERYDAVDPEEMGAEWLQRALDAEGPGKPHE